MRCPLLAGIHSNSTVPIIPHIHHLAMLGFGEVCLVWALFSADYKIVCHHKYDDIHNCSQALPCCFAKWLYHWSHPRTDQAIPVAKPHGGFIRTRWAVLPYKLSRVEKHWAGFSQACFGGTESDWSTHFLSLPFPGMSERSQAKNIKPAVAFGQASTRTVW